MDTVLSEQLRLLVWLSSICVGILWFTHVIACVWFIVGNHATSDTATRWVDVFDDLQPDEFGQYIIAFHWSLAQMTLGSIDVHCMNSTERTFNIVVTCMGFLFGSSLISLLSAALVDITMATKDRSQKVRILRQFLRENGVKRETSCAVQQQVLERTREHKRLTERNVQALDLLSMRLLAELRYEIARRPMSSHGLFFFLQNYNIKWCHRLALEAINLKALSAQDVLFFPGIRAESAFCVAEGALTYLQEPSTSTVATTTETVVEKGSWLSESTLWVQWSHVGTATVQEACQLIAISAAGLQTALQGHSQVQKIVVAYCKQFHDRVLAAVPPGKYPTDLAVPRTEWDEVVLSMEAEVKMTISFQASQMLDLLTTPAASGARVNWVAAKRPQEKLREEILSGRSIVVLTERGKPQRITSKVSVHFTCENEEDSIFAQIAKWRNGTIVPCCRYPSMTREQNEPTQDTIRRLLTTKLKPLAGAAQLQQQQEEVTTQVKDDGMETKYFRTICHMTVPPCVKAPCCSMQQPFDDSLFALDRVRSIFGGPLNVSVTSGQTAKGFSGGTPAEPASPKRRSRHASEVVAHKYRERMVYFFREETAGAWYVWLTHQEFDYFESPAGREELRLWVSALGPPPLEQESGVNRDI